MTEGLKNRGVENIGCNSNKPGITLSPFVLRSKNIGEVARSDGGVNKTDGVRIQASPRFRLYRAVKSQGRRRKKGEDCPSEASSADPDGDRSDEPKAR